MGNNLEKVLHIGCGRQKLAGAVGVDIDPDSSADIIFDLNKRPYPFNANSFDLVFAEHIIEHLTDIVGVMEEIHRIGKNGARVKIISSHFSSVDSFTDITHKHFLTSMSFDYFIPGTPLYAKHSYSKVKYKKIGVRVGPVTNNWLLKGILGWVNKNLVWYESRIAFIFPVGVICYELEVVK